MTSFLSDFLDGNDLVKKCIDVSYIENLFWKVDKETTSKYWSLLPTDMQALYIRFHGKIPT